jgi:uncharacterized protein
MAKHACPQCVAKKNDGSTQCKIKTCKYHPKCWIHTQGQDKIKIDKSTIPNAGNGLFTLKNRDTDELIAKYTGKRVTKAYLNKKYGKGKATYAVRVGRTGNYIDAQDVPSGMARYANDVRGTNKRPNAELAHTGKTKRAGVVIVAKHPISVKREKNSKGKQEMRKEILLDYGKDYWKDEQWENGHKRAKKRRV